MAQQINQGWPENVYDQAPPAPTTPVRPVPSQTDWFHQEQFTSLLSQADLLKRIHALEKDLKELRALFKVNTVFVNTLGNGLWEVKQPLAVAIEQRAENDFVGCLYDLDLYGYGETIPEAIEDLRSAIVNQFEYLLVKEKQVRFSEPLERQFVFLKSIMVPASA